MSNLTPVINNIDWLNRRIYLKQWVIDFFPIEDIYHEYRTLRRSDTDGIRKYNPLIKAEGNISKGAGAFTPRYVVLLEGTKIVPFDEASQLNQLWDIITDDPDNDPDLYDISGLTTAKPIFIKPSEAETIQLNSESIVFSSFQWAVWIDVNSPYSDKWSATTPNGNTERPVNNTQLAVEIAQERWFNKLMVISNLTLDTWDNVTDFKMVWQSHVNTQLIINPWADCLRTSFSEFNLTGTMDWDSDIFSCIVWDIQYFNWHIHNSYLYGTFTLWGTEDCRIDDCKILNVWNPVTITAWASGQDIMLSNYSGRIILDNITGASKVGIWLAAWEVVINPNCIAWSIALSGNWDLTDNSADSCYVINKLTNWSEIQSLQKLIEWLRPHHTGTWDIWYWNPYNWNDLFDWTTPNTALKTFAKAHDLAKNANHDIIYCLPWNPNAVTESNENITISKDYLFLRWPWRDFCLNWVNPAQPVITITARWTEISWMRLQWTLTDTAPVIHTTGDFTLMKNIWISWSNNWIHIENCEYWILDSVKSHHNNWYWVLIDWTAEHTDIIDCHIWSNWWDGITVNLDNTFHEVNILWNTIIHKNTWYWVNISATTSTVIFSKDVEVFANTVWEINDLWTWTYIPTSWLDETELHSSLDSYTNKDDYKATTTISSNMRGTDDANKVTPDNASISAIKIKTDTLINYDDTITQNKLDIIDQNVDDIEIIVNALENYDDTAINIKLDNILSWLSTMQLSINTLQSDIDDLWIDIWVLWTNIDSIQSYVEYQERCVFVNEDLTQNWDWTSANPFNNLDDTVVYAEWSWIRCIKLLSDATATRNLKNFVVSWIWTYILDCNWQNLDKSEFSHLIMRWAYTWQIIVQECVLDDWFVLNWFFDKNAVNGDLTCIWNVLFSNNFSNIPWLDKPRISVDWHKVSIRNYSWWILIADCDSILSEITVEVSQWKIYLENTCTLWIISCRGNATIDDQSNWSTVDLTSLLNQEFAERVTRWSMKILWTVLIAYDELWEIQRWDLADVNIDPSNENVFYRTKQ